MNNSVSLPISLTLFFMFTRQLQKNIIETERGYWKSLAAAPLGVGYVHFQAGPGFHLK